MNDLKIISDNCLELDEDTYLFKIDRPRNILMLFFYHAGSRSAAHITTMKLTDNSIENIRELFRSDPYYRKMLERAAK